MLIMMVILIIYGERSKVGGYGLPGSGFLLLNDGQGNFSDQTASVAPHCKILG